MAAPTTSEKELLALGNEVLSNIVTQLDPPAAVCLALSCKHLKDVVDQVCGVEIGNIIPKVASATQEAPHMLQPYNATRKEKRLFGRNKRIAYTFTHLGLNDTVDLAVPFSLERIGLLDLLGHDSEHLHTCTGHYRYVAHGSDYCAICPFLGLMDDEYEAVKSDEPEEMDAMGAITYDENGNVNQGGDEEDDHRDDGSDLGDSEDGADDGPDPNESGLDDGDSITINSDSERCADEDDQVIEDGDTNPGWDTEMQDEYPISKAPDDQDDRNDYQSVSAGEVAGDSEADAEDDTGPSDDDNDSDPDGKDSDDEREDYEHPHIEKKTQ